MEITFYHSADEKPLLAKINQRRWLFFRRDVWKYRNYLVAHQDGIVMGMIVFNHNTQWMDNAFGVSAVEVLPAFKNQGIAKALITELFRHAEMEGKDISITPYEDEGERYIKHIFRRCQHQYDVMIQERT